MAIFSVISSCFKPSSSSSSSRVSNNDVNYESDVKKASPSSEKQPKSKSSRAPIVLIGGTALLNFKRIKAKLQEESCVLGLSVPPHKALGIIDKSVSLWDLSYAITQLVLPNQALSTTV
ncbi:hypothetical protein JRO89_XS05G0157400 [Xanthoceras sorbifolium]|uniref:Uncharacterized protein n=1 Tax=Xanthoceras sorbifolium TaxID=99658 RepID=A0ABQ8I2K5_9ROSI|nr:hypothetical protein JRO89_XS05G0157400 [Xanthoceras sorbifolium]